jgi:pectate lyase
MERTKRLLTRCVIVVTVMATLFCCPNMSAMAQAEETRIAFPGAQGAGKFTEGGRGGDVYRVTSLQNSGHGSLREAIESAQGPRTIVFEVAGTIRLKSKLVIDKKTHLTIAGQTAPGKGITLADQCLQIDESSHIIIRYLRIRLGDENNPKGSGPDCITVEHSDHIMLDHLSLSWGIDGNGDFRGLDYVTLQWLIFSEALHDSLHGKGPHGMCSSYRDGKGPATMHHNIYASSRTRHPTINAGPAVVEFCNNLDYNWEKGHNLSGDQLNLLANYYKAGPSMRPGFKPIQFKSGNKPPSSKGYFTGNHFEGLSEEYNTDNYLAMDYKASGLGFSHDHNYQDTSQAEFEVSRRFNAGEYTLTQIESAEQAYQSCLKYSGCSLVRDMVDERFIKTIIENTGKIIDSQDDVGGWDPYGPVHRPENWDTDKDGMPDHWEKTKGLDPEDPGSGNRDRDSDGYTNLEEYLNSLCPAIGTLSWDKGHTDSTHEQPYTRHLVLDSRKIASSSNVQLVLGKIKKHPANPLFGEEKPWEQRFDNFYGSIVYDEDTGLYRLWWNPFIYDPDEGAEERENGVEYAFSRDGICWTKPELGMVEYEGSKNNNLMNRDSGHGHGIFKDPHETDASKRYKMIAREKGVSVATSADGMHWSDWIEAFKAKADTHNNAIWAPTLNRYVAISREFLGDNKDKTRRRVVARAESRDFLSDWSDVEIVMDGGPDFQIYSNAVFYHAGVYLGLIAIFDTSDGPTDNRVWTELAWSPDTRQWHRLCQGTPFIPNSTVEGAPDWGTAYACLNPLFRDTDEVRIYYGGCDGKHNRYRDGYLMLATIRKDRWAGYQAMGVGTIETAPLTCDGSNLYICADVQGGGSVGAEIIDINGLRLSDCKPIKASVSDGRISWAGKDLKALKGSPIRLRFKLNKATVYSFFTR